MEVRAIVGIAGTDETYPITFEKVPEPGESITLTVEGISSHYYIVDVDPTGFENSAPYLYRVYVKPSN